MTVKKNYGVVPTVQQEDQDFFYYNTPDDEVEIMEVLGYNQSSGYEDEDRVAKFW